MTSQAGVIRCELREEPLSVDDALADVRDPACGGVVLFLGAVRDHDHGRDVADLDYSAHPTAAAALRRACEEVLRRSPGVRLVAVHRVGHLRVGDLAVVVAAAAPHRGEAFAACRDLIDTLKATTPIWKHQHFRGGDDEWVGLP